MGVANASFVGGPLDGKKNAEAGPSATVEVFRLDDESLHVYQFTSSNMSDGRYEYLGAVVGPPGDERSKQVREVLGDEVCAVIMALVQDEVARQIGKHSTGIDIEAARPQMLADEAEAHESIA